MKNKKLLTRLFALFASLVLVLALALPCFADTVSSDVYVTRDFTVSTVAEFQEILNTYNDQIISFTFTYMLYGSTATRVVLDDIRVADNFVYACAVFQENTQRAETFCLLLNSPANLCTLNRFIWQKSNDAWSCTQEQLMSASGTLSYQLIITVREVYVGSSGGDDNSSIPSSDMYSNLFNILKDAVYGSDAELTGSQEYALTLISTILTYATILLPVILVIFIAVWCFKRF